MRSTVRAARELIVNTTEDAVPGQLFVDQLMRSIAGVVGFDGYCLFAVDPITGIRCAMYSQYGLEASAHRHLRNETVEHDVNRYVDLIRRPGHAGVLALRVTPEPRSPRLHEILRPQGYESELRLSLVADARYWGALVLFRAGRLHPFNDTDAELVAELAGPLCAALRRYQVRRPDGVTEARPAGVVLVGRDNRLLDVSPEAAAWLDDLTSGGPDGVGVVDASRILLEVAAAATGGSRDPICRVRTRKGRWLVISGSRPQLAEVDVTLVIQPADLSQSLPAFGVWCGLTPRESEVLKFVAGGLAAKQIARRLEVSPSTVNEHLRATYRKAGTRGRDELLALIT
jgi:DNA-binding CsgD family transcriptional regulator